MITNIEARILKTIEPYFGMIWGKTKTFELRKNDRDFQVNDLYYLVEYDPISEQFLNRWVLAKIVCVIETGHLVSGCVALGIEEIDRGCRSSTEIKDLSKQFTRVR